MPNTPQETDEKGRLDESWPDDESGVSDRPTVAPPFDLESYARETAAAPSDVAPSPDKARRMTPPLPTTPPPLAKRSLKGSLEERIDELFDGLDEPTSVPSAPPSDTALTLPPPPSPFVSHAIGGAIGGPPPNGLPKPSETVGVTSDPPSRRQTPPGAARIEAARALSARGDVGSGVLSLANMRVPSDLPPRPPLEDPVVTVGMVSIDDDTDLPEEVRAEAARDPRGEMRERFALGDFSGALVVAEALLGEDPTHAEAHECAERCRAVLGEMYAARIGPLDGVPVVQVARDQLRWLSIDHRAGFVLSLVDGVSSLEMILDVSGMPSLDALRILYELLERRIVSIRKT